MNKLLKTVAIVLAIGLIACTKNAPMESDDSDYNNAISSLEDFNNLVNEDVAPINKLSQDAIDKFSASLVFDGPSLVSAEYGVIDQELSPEDAGKFWQLIIGQSLDLQEDNGSFTEVSLVGEDGATLRCNKWIYLRNMVRNGGVCSYQQWSWCRTCVGHDE